MKTVIILIVLAALVGAGVMAYRANQEETTEERTLTKLPPSVQHAVGQMDPSAQGAFFNEYWRKRRKVSVGYLAWFFFGFQYLYARKVGVQVVYWLTWLVGIGEVWWLIDFFRIPRIMADSNEQVAREALQTLNVVSYRNPGMPGYPPA